MSMSPKVPPRPSDDWLVLRLRWILCISLTAAIVFPGISQPLLDHAWAILRENAVYRWSTFETIWTVFWYAAVEVSLTVYFIKHPERRLIGMSRSTAAPSDSEPARIYKKPRGMRRPSRRLKEIFLYVLPLATMDLTMIKKFADVPLPAMLETGSYDMDVWTGGNASITNGRLPPRTFLVPTFHNFSLDSPLQTTRAVPLAAPSSRRLALELSTSLFLFDLLFFLFHVSLHRIPTLRRVHAPHHAHDAQLNPQVTNQLTVPERLGLVLAANFSLNIIGAHVLTRTLFVPVFVWLLVEIHCGLDLPWAYDKVLPRGWAGGAAKHLRHHRIGEGDFEPFFCWWDGALRWLDGAAIKAK